MRFHLILVTSNWVKEMYVRDGINGDKIEVLPVGCDTDLLSLTVKMIRKFWPCAKHWGFHLIS